MARTLRAVLDEANPNKLPAASQDLRLGSALRGMNAYAQGALTDNVLVLPEEAKAAQVLVAFARAGTFTGYLTAIAPGGTPATGQVAVTQTGDLAFAAIDAITDVEAFYAPLEGEVFEEELAVIGDAITLPQDRGALVLLSATGTAGTATGAKAVQDRGAAPAAGQTALDATGRTIAFAAADALTRATVRYVARPGSGSGVQASLAARLSKAVDY